MARVPVRTLGCHQPIGNVRGRQALNASGSIVQFENVGLRYGTGAETLSDLAFSLREGGFYFLTGPSGAGRVAVFTADLVASATSPPPSLHEAAGSWNQLLLQLAQRTCRPLAPTALSGTT